MNRIDSLDARMAKEYLNAEFEEFKKRFSEVEEINGPYKEWVVPEAPGATCGQLVRVQVNTYALGKKECTRLEHLEQLASVFVKSLSNLDHSLKKAEGASHLTWEDLHKKNKLLLRRAPELYKDGNGYYISARLAIY